MQLTLPWHPERFHGALRSAPFFEGWYYNFATASGDHRYAIIAGIFLGADSHAFIQMLDGVRNTATYHRFAVSEFSARADRFEVTIAQNAFSATHMRLALPRMRADLRFARLQPWPWRPWSPGSMGPLSLLPFLPCYHHVLSVGHDVSGAMQVDGSAIALTGARGYLEKNWGSAFPSAWLWLQSNHFARSDARLLATFAQIPVGPLRSRGLTAAIAFDAQMVRFTTANGGHVMKFERNGDCAEVGLSNFRAGR